MPRSRHGRPGLHGDDSGIGRRRAAAGRESRACFRLVDMRLGCPGSGLDGISAVKKRRPEARAIILTGHGNIASVVNAMKLGADDYLAKPVDADDVAAALLARDNKKVQVPENPMTAARVRWEHIQRIYELSDRNISETARRLKMHWRTLQRILNKRAPK